MSPVYRRPDAAYHSVPPNVEAEPIWGEPYYYYRGVPQDWGYGKYEGGPYWYRHGPAEDGYYYYGPKYRDQGPRLYERDCRDFGRDFRPVYVYPPPAPAAASGPCAFRPFNPGDQFRHPDEYPMRFVPVTNASSGPWEIKQAIPHCFGCANHVCHPGTMPMKGIEWKGLNSEEDAKAKPHQLARPGMWFNPSEWRNRASESKDQNEEKEKGKEEYPVNWIPVHWNKNDGENEQSGQFPGYWIPLAWNQIPQGGEEKKKKFPGYWVPLDWNRRSQGGEEESNMFPGFWIPQASRPSPRPQDREEEKNIFPLDGKEDKNKFPGWWIPLDSSSTPQGREEDKKIYSFEGKSQPFPVLWIPEVNRRPVNPQEVAKNESLEKEHKKTNEADDRPVIVQEVGKEDEKQRSMEGRMETKVRDIPVKQIEEEKSTQAQKTEEKVTDNYCKVSSPRASKLPPVCLRVDPLPDKKKSSGKSSSRSPSPPRKEENTKDDITSKSSVIASASSTANVEKNIKPDADKVSVETKKVEVNANLNASKVAGEAKKDDENESLKASKLTSEVKNAEDLKASKVQGEAKNIELKEDLNVQIQEARDKKTELSRDQAALKIQAFYEGYQMRKLQPLRKLREIAKIRKRVEELKQQISSPEFLGELSRDNKTKLRMSETLMGLLLQLDTIQGLHPMVRDVRKSVARELVQLQEKFDTFVEEAHTRNSQSCKRDATENNVSTAQVKIDNADKDLEAAEDPGKTLLNTSTENHQVDIEIRKDDEFAQEKETFALSNDGKENVFLEKVYNDNKEETENTTTKYGENLDDNVPVQQEALEASDNLEAPSLPMHLQKVETESQDENVMNERELASLVTSEDIISTANNAQMPLQNVAMGKEEKSDPSLENISVEKEEISERSNFMELDSSALPQELDAALEKEICPASIPVQEEEVAASDNSKVLDENANALGKSATLEQGRKWVVIKPDAEIENKFSTENVEVSDNSKMLDENGNALEKNVTLEKRGKWVVIEPEAEPEKQISTEKVEAFENSNMLEENANALEKNSTLEQGGKGVVIEPEAEPENHIRTEKLDLHGSELNKAESKEIQNACTDSTAGDDILEFNTEASSQIISDSLSGSHSDGIEKINLNKVDKALLAPENLTEEGNSVATMTQVTDDPIVEKPTVASITGNGLSTVNTKNDLRIQNEKHAAKCSGPSGGTESGTSDMVDKLVMESSLNENDLVHYENITESEANILKSVRNQVHEKWENENEKLREMVEKLVEAERIQMSTISQLNDRIKQLENKLSKGKGMRKARARQLRLRSNRVARNSKNATALGC